MFDFFVFLPLSTRAYFKGRAYIKIILKNHARFYFAGRSYYRETRQLQPISRNHKLDNLIADYASYYSNKLFAAMRTQFQCEESTKLSHESNAPTTWPIPMCP